MSFIVQRIDGTKVYVREFKGSTLRVGRGTDAQLRSESASMALEHAVIHAVEEGFELSDRESITGTYVNGNAIQEATLLRRGDIVEIGDLQVGVETVAPGQRLVLRVRKLEGDAVDVEEEKVPVGVVTIPKLVLGAPLKAPKVDYVASYSLAQEPLSKRSLGWLALGVALATVALLWLGRLSVVFRPGELTKAHAAAAFEGKRLIGDDDCSACHAPFRGASVTRCQECHQRVGHQESLATLGPCTACHSEHRPIPNVEQVWQAMCLSCHEDLTAHAEPGKAIRVASRITKFEEKSHPEFLVTVEDGDQTKRLSLADASALAADLGATKFDHQGHLTGTFNERPPGPGETEKVKEKLTCVSCHDLEDGGLMDARSYEKYCQRCHQLTFDNRFPPVPHHLNLDTVAGYIANAYSGNQALLRMNAAEVTRVLGAQREALPQAAPTDPVVRNAQQVIKTRCLHCHEFTERGDAVIPARRQSRWFPGAKPFNHISHLNPGVKARCVDCHADVLRSKKASDVNMPSMKTCTGCHKAAGPYQVRSIDTCETCHAYHARTARLGKGWALGSTVVPERVRLKAGKASPGGGAEREAPAGRGFPRIPLWLASTLPAALALFALAIALLPRAMRSRVARVSGAQGPSLPFQKALTLPSPGAPPPPPVAPLKPRNRPGLDVVLPEIPSELPDRTIVLELPTVFVVFLDGPLAGMRLPIDPVKGAYIGRDSAVANIVVGMTNLSRRHVWIGAVEGKIVAIDQNSTNGTFVGSSTTRITQIELQPGDVITLGENDVRFRFEA